ncbi:hypothetical protein D3C72_1646720 [compost metagenome]
MEQTVSLVFTSKVYSCVRRSIVVTSVNEELLANVAAYSWLNSELAVLQPPPWFWLSSLLQLSVATTATNKSPIFLMCVFIIKCFLLF